MRTAWKIALALILLLVPLLFNRELVDFRMEELSHLLDRAAAIENIPNAAGILGKYELIRSRLEKGETESEIYRSEARAQILAAFDQIVLSDEPARTAGFHVLPVRPVVNGIRRVVGADQVTSIMV